MPFPILAFCLDKHTAEGIVFYKHFFSIITAYVHFKFIFIVKTIILIYISGDKNLYNYSTMKDISVHLIITLLQLSLADYIAKYVCLHLFLCVSFCFYSVDFCWDCFPCECKYVFIYEPAHDKTYNKTCMTSKDSD